MAKEVVKALSKEQTEKLKKLKITAKSVSEAREKLIEALAKNDVDGVDNDPLDELIIMYESFFEEGTEEEEIEEEEEVEIETPKAKAKGDQFTKMTRDELKVYNTENELGVKVMKSDTDEDIRVKLRAAIVAATEEETEEEVEEDYKETKTYKKLAKEVAEEEKEEVEEAEVLDELVDLDRDGLKAFITKNKLDVKVMKSNTDEDIRVNIRSTQTPVTKAKVASKTPTAAKKAAAPKKEDKEKKRGYDVEKDLKGLAPLIKMFPGQEVKKLKAGITIQHAGKSSKRVLISFDHIKVAPNGEMTGDVFFNIFKGKEEVAEKVGEEFTIKNYNYNLCFIPKLTLEETMEMLAKDGLVAEMIRRSTLADGRALKNKEKLEEKMKGGDTKKSTVKKPAVEEIEEEEEETPALKKAVKVAAKKVVVVEEEEEEEEVIAPKKTAKKK